MLSLLLNSHAHAKELLLKHFCCIWIHVFPYPSHSFFFVVPEHDLWIGLFLYLYHVFRVLMCLFFKENNSQASYLAHFQHRLFGNTKWSFFPSPIWKIWPAEVAPVPSFSSLCRESLKWSSVSTIRWSKPTQVTFKSSMCHRTGR